MSALDVVGPKNLFTSEPSDQNKSCSACPEDQLETIYYLNFEFKFLNFEDFEILKRFPATDFQSFFWGVWYFLNLIFYQTRAGSLAVRRDFLT